VVPDLPNCRLTFCLIIHYPLCSVS